VRVFQSQLNGEERDRAVFKFLAEDSLRAQAQSIAIKRNGPFKVVDPEREQGDKRVHRRCFDSMFGARFGARRIGTEWVREQLRKPAFSSAKFEGTSTNPGRSSANTQFVTSVLTPILDI
jgi:hypothetical protein